MKLGNYLKEERNKKNLTQQQVAEKIHVSRQTISNWENEHSYPDLESLVSLSDLYGVSLDQLLKGDQQIVTFYSDLAKVSRKTTITFYFFYFLNILLAPTTIFFDFFYDNTGVTPFSVLLHGALTINLFFLIMFKFLLTSDTFSKKNIRNSLSSIGIFIVILILFTYFSNLENSIDDYISLGFSLGEYMFMSVKSLSVLMIFLYPRSIKK
ncbi:helix-turn-helix domain-containing protein [Enterococcus wangshanyuanii]|uniref:Transcriptional regulator n=1 Tax=Enterococcus wangshanyuanii TaxID=2005703 RepID=A0ABQ1PE07_9ENTE|nr:helix-turn-helix transcriptional regulator [Enterococcus wangshanyuanii]GGC95380.1 transcriptional regulator [Enterococcus wangshanyuanii]